MAKAGRSPLNIQGSAEFKKSRRPMPGNLRRSTSFSAAAGCRRQREEAHFFASPGTPLGGPLIWICPGFGRGHPRPSGAICGKLGNWRPPRHYSAIAMNQGDKCFLRENLLVRTKRSFVKEKDPVSDVPKSAPAVCGNEQTGVLFFHQREKR